jgi:hypothetical protein
VEYYVLILLNCMEFKIYLRIVDICYVYLFAGPQGKVKKGAQFAERGPWKAERVKY